MDIALLILGFIFMLVGRSRELFAWLPGHLSVGLAFYYVLTSIPLGFWWFLGITLGIALLVLVMDYIIFRPIVFTKNLAAVKSGMVWHYPWLGSSL